MCDTRSLEELIRGDSLQPVYRSIKYHSGCDVSGGVAKAIRELDPHRKLRIRLRLDVLDDRVRRAWTFVVVVVLLQWLTVNQDLDDDYQGMTEE
jgi:hypothetical protein